jgi:hypothetical protein
MEPKNARRELRPERPKSSLGYSKAASRDSKVVQTSGDHLKDAVSSAELALVEFYAPWYLYFEKLSFECA